MSEGTDKMRQEIVEKVSAGARKAGLDAIIAISPENFAYLAGFVVPSQPLIRHRHAAAIVTASGGIAVFGVDMEATTDIDAFITSVTSVQWPVSPDQQPV